VNRESNCCLVNSVSNHPKRAKSLPSYRITFHLHLEHDEFANYFSLSSQP
jgi:hypothetical protein